MARLHGKTTRIYLDEFDFSAIATAVDLNIDCGLAEVTAFADTDATFVEGKSSASATINGLWSLTSPTWDPQLFTDISTAMQVGIYPRGATDGYLGYEFEGYQTEQPRTAEAATAITLNTTFEGDNNLVRTYILDVNTALAASANGTAYNVGAVSSTQEAYGILRAFSVTGGPGTLDVVIASDDEEAFGGSPATVLTFTQLGAVGEEVKYSGAGAITDDWWRVQYTVAGGGTWSVLVTFGIRTATIP